MGRDGRGTPGRTAFKDHVPRLKLSDLLRRRRTTLRAFVSELGVFTYSALEIWCKRMGVLPPTNEEFLVIFPHVEKVNSAQEGVVVLEPLPVIDEQTGSVIDPEAPIFQNVEIDVVVDVPVTDPDQYQLDHVATTEPTEASQKKTRKKKEFPATEA